MDNNVDEMIAEQSIAMEIVIEGKGYIGDRTVKRTVKCCLPYRIPAEAGQTDMPIRLDMVPVIKNKGTLKGIGIQEKNDTSKKKIEQGAENYGSALQQMQSPFFSVLSFRDVCLNFQNNARMNIVLIAILALLIAAKKK